MALNDLLANIVFVIHVLVVIFFVYAPLSNSPTLWVLALISSVFTMSHWAMPGPGQDTCCLTVCERWLRGCDKGDSFFHNIMSPIYKAVDKEEGTFTNEFTNRATWAAMIALTAVSAAKISCNWPKVKATFVAK